MPKGPFFCALHHALWHTDTLSELLRKNNSLTLKSTRREKTKNDIVGDSVGTGHDRARGGHGHKQVAPIRQVSPLHVGDARPRDPCVYLAPIVLGLGLGLGLPNKIPGRSRLVLVLAYNVSKTAVAGRNQVYDWRRHVVGK